MKSVRSLTFADPGELVPEQVQLVHSAKLAEHVHQVLFVHRPGYLAHEHFYVVGFRLFAVVAAIGRGRTWGWDGHFYITESKKKYMSQ